MSILRKVLTAAAIDLGVRGARAAIKLAAENGPTLAERVKGRGKGDVARVYRVIAREEGGLWLFEIPGLSDDESGSARGYGQATTSAKVQSEARTLIALLTGVAEREIKTYVNFLSEDEAKWEAKAQEAEVSSEVKPAAETKAAKDLSDVPLLERTEEKVSALGESSDQVKSFERFIRKSATSGWDSLTKWAEKDDTSARPKEEKKPVEGDLAKETVKQIRLKLDEIHRLRSEIRSIKSEAVAQGVKEEDLRRVLGWSGLAWTGYRRQSFYLHEALAIQFLDKASELNVKPLDAAEEALTQWIDSKSETKKPLSAAEAKLKDLGKKKDSVSAPKEIDLGAIFKTAVDQAKEARGRIVKDGSIELPPEVTDRFASLRDKAKARIEELKKENEAKKK